MAAWTTPHAERQPGGHAHMCGVHHTLMVAPSQPGGWVDTVRGHCPDIRHRAAPFGPAVQLVEAEDECNLLHCPAGGGPGCNAYLTWWRQRRPALGRAFKVCQRPPRGRSAAAWSAPRRAAHLQGPRPDHVEVLGDAPQLGCRASQAEPAGQQYTRMLPTRVEQYLRCPALAHSSSTT